MPPNRAARVKVILDRFDACPVECDGFTRIAHSELFRANVPHDVMIGTVAFGNPAAPDTIPLHYWIVLPDGTVVDYRLRMWLGETAPHGVFDPADHPTLAYRGTKTKLSTPTFVIDILKGGIS